MSSLLLLSQTTCQWTTVLPTTLWAGIRMIHILRNGSSARPRWQSEVIAMFALTPALVACVGPIVQAAFLTKVTYTMGDIADKFIAADSCTADAKSSASRCSDIEDSPIIGRLIKRTGCSILSVWVSNKISGQLLAFSPQIIIGCVPLAYEYFESSSSAMDNILYIPRTDQAESTEPK